ncbi:MAG: hypothetical protein Q8Q62_09855 [Mesorhizobium sp.]|nr:hypothetical protein [Mesorhizobium sp.]
MLERDGRCYARLVIPVLLRPFLNGKTELRTPLGGDRKAAKAAGGVGESIQRAVQPDW